MKLFANKKGVGNTGMIIMMLVIMLSINIGLAFMQAGLDEISTTSPNVFDNSNTPYAQYITGGNIQTGQSNLSSDLLPSDDSVIGESGNIISDTYSASKGWIKGTAAIFQFIGNMFIQPKDFLDSIGIPNSITLALQIIWSIIFLFLIVAWLFGRS